MRMTLHTWGKEVGILAHAREILGESENILSRTMWTI